MQHFTNPYTNPSNATLIFPQSLTGSLEGAPLETGDEIGVFDAAGNLVGAVVVEDTDFSAAAAAYSSLDDKGIDSGNPFILKVWDQSQNQEFTVIPTFEPCDGASAICADENAFSEGMVYTITDLTAPTVGNPEITETLARSVQSVEISWIVSSEPSGGSTYNVERRVVGQSWEAIDTVQTGFQSPEPVQHKYLDDRAPLAELEYRVSRDGAAGPSATISFNAPETAQLGDTRALSMTLSSTQNVLARLFNDQGVLKQVLFDSTAQAGESILIPVDTSPLDAGDYTVEIQGETIYQTHPFTV